MNTDEIMEEARRVRLNEGLKKLAEWYRGTIRERLSNCCHASVRAAGRTTRYYECTACDRKCETTLTTLKS